MIIFYLRINHEKNIAAFILSPNFSYGKCSGSYVNHTTIYVVDMNKSADFYEKALMLQRIPEPFHDGRHIWMKIGDHVQLHIVQV